MAAYGKPEVKSDQNDGRSVRQVDQLEDGCVV